MKIKSKDMVELTRDELDALFVIATDSVIKGASDETKDAVTTVSATISVAVENLIWGEKPVSEETLIQTVNFIRSEENRME